jgi:hypothetical protein
VLNLNDKVKILDLLKGEVGWHYGKNESSIHSPAFQASAVFLHYSLLGTICLWMIARVYCNVLMDEQGQDLNPGKG